MAVGPRRPARRDRAGAWPRHPEAADRAKFIEALSSPQPASWPRRPSARCTWAWTASRRKWPPRCEPISRPAGCRSRPSRGSRWFGCSNSGPKGAPTSTKIPIRRKPTSAGSRCSSSTIRTKRPSSRPVRARTPTDAGQRRLAAIDWSAGDGSAGRGVFERRACHRCHQVAGHLGPELKGAVVAHVARRSVHGHRRPESGSLARFSHDHDRHQRRTGVSWRDRLRVAREHAVADRARHDRADDRTPRRVVGAQEPAVADADRAAGHAFGSGLERLVRLFEDAWPAAEETSRGAANRSVLRSNRVPLALPVRTTIASHFPAARRAHESGE